MLKRGTLLFGSALAMVLGCGDDASTSGGGGSGGGTTSSTATSTGSGLPATTSVSGSSSTGIDPSGSGGETSSSGGGDPQGGSGPGSGGAGPGAGGGTFDSPCGAACAGDEGCEEVPPDPGDDCLECVLDEAEGAQDSDCTVAGVTSPCCTEFDACTDLVGCVLGGGTFDSCADENQEGYEIAKACVLATCGECGDIGEGGGGGGGGAGGGGTGGGTFDSPCGEECAADAGCDETPPAPTGACAACVQAEADEGIGSQCALAGATGSCCQDVPACDEYVDCVIGGGTQDECAETNPEGAEQARVCVLQSCGECGGDGAGGGGPEAPPCEEACADDAGCDQDPAAPSGDCNTCIQAEQDAQSGCAIQGAAGPC